MGWMTLYTQKIVSLHALAKACDTTVDALCARYANETVGNGISKAELFKNAVSSRYNGKQLVYINSVCNIDHNRDNRTPLQYATDLIIGWLSEDAVLSTLNNYGWFATLSGQDAQRNFLPHSSINHTADIEIPDGNIELVFDYTNHWARNNTLDLRDNKLQHLKDTETALLGIAPRTGKGFLLVAKDYEEFIPRNIPAYGKNGWTLNGVKDKMEPIDLLLSRM